MNFIKFIVTFSLILIIFNNLIFFSYLILSLGIIVIITIYSEHSERGNSDQYEIQKFIKQLDNCKKQEKSDRNVFFYQRIPLSNIFEPNIDSILQQILHFLVRDNMYILVKDYTFQPDVLCKNVETDLWNSISLLKNRLDLINPAKFITNDVANILTNHLEKVRIAQTVVAGSDDYAESILSSRNFTTEKEIEFLRKIVDIFLTILPKNYRTPPLKDFIREILANQVFHIINTITESSFINGSLIAIIESLKDAEKYTTKYLIHVNLKNKLTDNIKLIRYKIIMKLKELITEQNLLRSAGLDTKVIDKLNKNIDKLTKNEKKCEELLGSKLNTTNNNIEEEQYYNEAENFRSMLNILKEPESLEYFSQFMETLASQDLIGYWSAVEELRHTNSEDWGQMLDTIFHKYIKNTTTEIQLQENIVREIEENLTGNQDPALFYEIQLQVVKTLNTKYYKIFLFSDYCKEMIISMRMKHPEIIFPVENQVQKLKFKNKCEIDEEVDTEPTNKVFLSHENRTKEGNTVTDNINNDENDDNDDYLSIGDHLNYVRRRLDQLNRKITQKHETSGADASDILKREIRRLEEEELLTTSQLQRTDIWLANLGEWRTNIQNIVILNSIPQFKFKIFIVNSISSGESWTISRDLNQIEALHKKLTEFNPNINYPRISFLFNQTNKCVLERIKQQMQAYFNFILTDDTICSSEALYSFFNTSSRSLRSSSESLQSANGDYELTTDTIDSGRLSDTDEVDRVLKVNLRKKRKLYKTTNINEDSSNDEESTEIDKAIKDASAESIFALLDEIFGKKIVRTLLLDILETLDVHVSSKIEDAINFYFTKKTVYGYLTVLLQTVWPGGQLMEKGPAMTDEEREMIAKNAKKLLIDILPKRLFFLTLSRRKPKKGTLKIFNVLQSQMLNKQLLYEILKVTVAELFPEFRCALEEFVN